MEVTELKTILYFISLIIKVILLIILSPFIILILIFRFCLYKTVLKRQLIKSGMSRNEAGYLLKDLKMMDFMDFVKKKA
ncbi:MAG: hypothetical protein K0S55_1973 [Clostridia bacterium]|nr:hypothetical protein [Clostridia bacterium]